MSLSAQQTTKKIRLLITDSDGQQTTTIDTIVAGNTDMSMVLRQLGYDQKSLESSENANPKRQITIATEEILEMKEGQQSMSLDRSTYIDNTNQGKLNIEDFISIPPNAQVEDLPDGSKRILETKTDANGNTHTYEKIVRMGERERISNRSGQTSSWVQMEDGKLPPTVDMPKSWVTETYTDNSNPTGNVSVTIADMDMFDASTINKKYPELLNATMLNVSNFQVKPDFKQGHYRFSFTMPNMETATLYIYDVVGQPIQEETFSGNYDKLLADFHLYKQGTFMILITQDDYKWTKKVTFE